MQEFHITIIDKPSKDIVVAYILSRLVITANNSPIEDNFPDEYLFAVFVHTI